MKILITSRLNINKYISNKPVFIRDSKLIGFAVKVNPSGRHKYIVEYKKDGKSKRITIGNVNTTPLLKAREKALTIIADKENTLASSGKMSLALLMEEYLSVKTLKPATAEDYKRTVNQLFPTNKIIQNITSEYAKEWYISMKSTPTQADRCFRIINSFLNYALQMSYLTLNPFNIIKPIRYKANVRSQYLDPVEHLPNFWKILNHKKEITADIIKMYLLTGFRRNELHKSKLKGDVIVVSNTKNGSTHYIPTIKTMPLSIFDLKRDDWTKDVRKTLISICKEAGVPVVTVHDLRRTVASLCAYLGISLGEIKHLLNHSVSGDVTLRHYIQRKTDYLVPVMNKIENYYRTLS